MTSSVKESIKKNTKRIDEIIQNTFFSIEQCRKNLIINVKEENYAIHSLIEIQKSLRDSTNTDDANVRRELATLLMKFGTQNMADLVYVLFGEAEAEGEGSHNNKNSNVDLFLNIDIDKHAILWRFFHPIGVSDVGEDIFTMTHLDCGMLTHASSASNFHLEVYGAQFIYFVHCRAYRIHGWVDDVWLDSLHDNAFIRARKKAMTEHACVETFTLRDYLIADTAFIKGAITAQMAHIDMVKSNKIHETIPIIQKMKMSTQREFIIALFSHYAESTALWKYTTYLFCDAILLYELEPEQNMIYSSLPWTIKDQIKESISNSINYLDVVYKKYEPSLEQQIILFQVSDDIKERAMVKLKEWKNRGDENYKCKQYLEGLLRIPFGQFREEPVLRRFRALRNCLDADFVRREGAHDEATLRPILAAKIRECLPRLSLREFAHLATTVSSAMGTNLPKKMSKKQWIHEWNERIDQEPTKTLYIIYDVLLRENVQERLAKLRRLTDECGDCAAGLDKMRDTLDAAIYGHAGAKNQIIKVLGQWMTGEATGYCFGFEGAPGIGKTSLAKGLAECLRDDDGTARPFHFIALGGSSNGTTLEGHGYTYQNSTWGRIADILMESRCMNPIIYIDELDKVSKTEQGREIIGILTHLIDSTQNRTFQDKFFMGIPLDLSKVLFVFSYNHVEDIDRILLDRIHRVSFENISTKDKIVIVRKFLEPELNQRMGWTKPRICISDTVLENIIERYTAEPGVRKLKECLFDIWGEVNLEMIRCDKTVTAIEPNNTIMITMEKIENVYLAKYPETHNKVANIGANVEGYVYGLYANAIGQGGILPIQCTFFPTTTFMEMKCTGLIGNVMQESMNVAKTLAWNLISAENRREIAAQCAETKTQGIHIHCPEGSTPKDGPSGGCCIALALYSLWSKRIVRGNVAITGEVDLHGNVTAIGKLDAKIVGGLRAGITQFLFPEENERNFQEYLEKNTPPVNVRFTRLKHIRDILCLGDEIFVESSSK